MTRKFRIDEVHMRTSVDVQRSHMIEPRSHLLLEISSTKIEGERKGCNTREGTNWLLPIANGIINKPTNMSLTARLTMSIFDAVCNFLTRQTASITTRLPTMVTQVINEQIIMIRTKMAVLRDCIAEADSGVVALLVSSYSLIPVAVDTAVDVRMSRRRDVLKIVVDPLAIGEVDDGLLRCCCCCCCWAETTEANRSRMDKTKRDMEKCLEPTTVDWENDDSRQQRRLCKSANVDSKLKQNNRDLCFHSRISSIYLSFLETGEEEGTPFFLHFLKSELIIIWCFDGFFLFFFSSDDDDDDDEKGRKSTKNILYFSFSFSLHCSNRRRFSSCGVYHFKLIEFPSLSNIASLLRSEKSETKFNSVIDHQTGLMYIYTDVRFSGKNKQQMGYNLQISFSPVLLVLSAPFFFIRFSVFFYSPC